MMQSRGAYAIYVHELIYKIHVRLINIYIYLDAHEAREINYISRALTLLITYNEEYYDRTTYIYDLYPLYITSKLIKT